MPEIGEVFYPRTRAEWRGWLEANHAHAREVWVRRFVKAAAQPTISYDDLVEECLCFGWIDGVVKKLDADSSVARTTPRRAKGSFLSELNRQRVWKLQRLGQMTPAGLTPIADQIGSPEDPLILPDWIEVRLRADPELWRRYRALPHLYRRLKIAWISELTGARRAAEAEKRLEYFIAMTRAGKRYGTEPEVIAPEAARAGKGRKRTRPLRR